MALPMVHMDVASSARHAGNGLDVGQYLLGSIAPDGIHARQGSTRADKRRVHLIETGDTLEARLGRIDGLLHGSAEKLDRAFVAGWATHLASDFLWSHYFVHGYWDHHSAGLSRERKVEAYYRETDKVDFLLYHSVPWRDKAWGALRAAEPREFAGILSAEEIGAWRDRLLRWFTELMKEPEEQPQFFTRERVACFVEVAATVCDKGLSCGFAEAATWVLGKYRQDFLEGVAEVGS